MKSAQFFFKTKRSIHYRRCRVFFSSQRTFRVVAGHCMDQTWIAVYKGLGSTNQIAPWRSALNKEDAVPAFRLVEPPDRLLVVERWRTALDPNQRWKTTSVGRRRQSIDIDIDVDVDIDPGLGGGGGVLVIDHVFSSEPFVVRLLFSGRVRRLGFDRLLFFFGGGSAVAYWPLRFR